MKIVVNDDDIECFVVGMNVVSFVCLLLGLSVPIISRIHICKYANEYSYLDLLHTFFINAKSKIQLFCYNYNFTSSSINALNFH